MIFNHSATAPLFFNLYNNLYYYFNILDRDINIPTLA